MIVQIYAVQTPAEGVALANIGVDNIGIVPCDGDQPGAVKPEIAKKIFDSVGDHATKVALSVDADLDHIVEMVNFLKPDILHLSGLIDLVPPAAVAELRRRLLGQKIMQAIPIQDRSAIAAAREFEAVADYLILDSKSEDIYGTGASGATHDWSIDREIVRQSRVPVILAGGLSAENVAEAIRYVRPWGVDSLTKTNLPGSQAKDIEKVKKFIAAARVETFANTAYEGSNNQFLGNTAFSQ
jgi:phosphoribosylanthranilate isomerase